MMNSDRCGCPAHNSFYLFTEISPIDFHSSQKIFFEWQILLVLYNFEFGSQFCFSIGKGSTFVYNRVVKHRKSENFGCPNLRVISKTSLNRNFVEPFPNG
jgi:hypothetical protein